MTPSNPAISAPRAVICVFFTNGFTLAAWIANIPLIKDKFGLSETALGLVLLSTALGGMVAMPLAGIFITRLGSRAVTRAGILVFVLLPLLPLTASNLPWLVVSLFLFGALQGASDVAMNSQAVAVEDSLKKPIMSSFHGFWSLGSLTGAGLGIAMISLGAAPALHAVIVSLCGLAILSFALPGLLVAGDEQPGTGFVLPSGPLLLLSALTFFALIGEGAVADWSAVYLHEVLGSSQGFAGAGFAAFSLTMAFGRFLGDALNARFGAVGLLRSSALLTCFGLALALLVPTAISALIGFAAMGFGVANLIPLLFGAAGRIPGISAGTGIAAVTTVGYTAFLAGPPSIGLTADLIGLRGALLIVALLIAIIAVFAPLIKANARTSRADTVMSK